MVPLHVAWQLPPSQVVSHPAVPLHTISEPMPTWNVHSRVPLQLAVQASPHAAVQPAVLLHVTVQPSPQRLVHAVVPLHVHVSATQRQASPPPMHAVGPPGLGARLAQPATSTEARPIEGTSQRVTGPWSATRGSGTTLPEEENAPLRA